MVYIYLTTYLSLCAMSLQLIVYKKGSVHSVRLAAQIHLCEISATKRTRNKSRVSYPVQYHNLQLFLNKRRRKQQQQLQLTISCS